MQKLFLIKFQPKKINLGNKSRRLGKEIFYPTFLAITFEPEMLESQSKAQKTNILA